MGLKKTAYAVRLSYFSTMIMVMRLLQIGVVLLILVFLLHFAVPFIGNAHSFKYINVALSLEKSLYNLVPHYVPTKIAGKDVTRVIMLVGVFILAIIINRIQGRFMDEKDDLLVKVEYEQWKQKMQLPDDEEVLSTLEGKLQKLKTSNTANREELLKLFAETKRKLDLMGKDLAFLSIDVVDSTGMKYGEEKAAAEHDFMEYRKLVENKLTVNGALKTTWTPDGMMSCFTTVDSAVRTAREIINSLDAFNRNVKTMKHNFQIRCGINYGFVHFDESIPLSDISDRVVDIAGHMQKQAKPNTICIAKSTVEPIQERNGFIPAGRVVDGYEVYVWEKN